MNDYTWQLVCSVPVSWVLLEGHRIKPAPISNREADIILNRLETK